MGITLCEIRDFISKFYTALSKKSVRPRPLAL